MMSPNKHRQRLADLLSSAVVAGLEPLRVQEPLRLSQWAAQHFYLSSESSYTEGRWTAYPYQIAMLDCIGNDDIVEVDVPKSARIGYTKCLLAAIGYFAEHKHRNQAIWQPTDADRDEFTKVELETMLRDVPIMAKIFPSFMSRHKDNTLKAKKFLTGMLHLRGGTSAKSYRRISIDVAYLDELDAFDQDIDGEGLPFNLAKKRLEGAIFPKIIAGTTPKTAGLSHIESRVQQAEATFLFHVPCPSCGHEHPLTWGGNGTKKEASGLTWVGDDPDTAGHVCPGCGVIYSQQDYLANWHRGRWINADTGDWIDDTTGQFRSAEGATIHPPAHLALPLWTAYSPQATWPGIVREYLNALVRSKAGDHLALKTFTNTTLGQAFEEECERTDADELRRRAEPYALRTCPDGVLALTAFVDVQGDRFELVVWGFGRGDEMWAIDYQVIDGINPFVDDDWLLLDKHLEAVYPHACGSMMGIEAVGIDTGYATHQAYRFCRLRERRRIYATKGETADNKPIKSRRTTVDVRQRTGKAIPNGCRLHFIGTDAAKDTIFGRLHVDAPGPGYIHLSDELPIVFYEQLVSEVRILQLAAGQHVFRWVKPNQGVRNEVLDCTVGSIWGIEMLTERYRDVNRFWDEMERRLSDDRLPLPREPVVQSTNLPAPSPRPVKNIPKHGLGRSDWVL